MFVLGIALIFLGAWGIDFAHLGYIRLSQGGDGRIGLPILPNRDILVSPGFWWNANFFGGVVLGSIFIIIGAVL